MVCAAACALVLGEDAQPAGAFHIKYLIEDPAENPGPSSGTLRGLHSSWITDGTPYGICAEKPLPGPVELALRDWEDVLPGDVQSLERPCNQTVQLRELPLINRLEPLRVAESGENSKREMALGWATRAGGDVSPYRLTEVSQWKSPGGGCTP